MTSKKRSHWLAGAAAVLMAGGAAHAQTAPPADAATVTTTTDPKTGETRRTSTSTDNGVTTSATAVSNASGQLEEVVVTANKRRENLQEVPIAVTAITAQTAAAVGVTDVSSLQTTVPGLQFPRIASGTTPALRGVGTTFGFGGQENLVALYMDDVYIASPAAATFSFNNIDQIEVLKGPQGTLFGRNALAGVINVTTRTPGASPRADISVGYANYNTLSGSFYGSTPIGDKLAADIAIMGDNQIDGWGRNLTTGKPAFTTRDLAIRSKWVYRPDDVTTVTLIGDFNDSRYDAGTAAHAVEGHLLTDGQSYPGFYNIAEDHDPYTDTKQGGVSLKIDRDLGWANLINIAAGRWNTPYNALDTDYSAAATQFAQVHDNSTTQSEELRLVSKDTGKLHWVAGFFYFHDLSDITLHFTGNSIGPGSLDIDFKQFIDSYAGYGQATYDLPEDFHLTLGARYTYDQIAKNARQGLSFTSIANLVSIGQTSEDKFTYKATLAKDITKNISAYVGYSTGYKGGIYNSPTVADGPVKPETLGDVEGGIKTELFDRRLRLNIAAYHYDYENLQVSAITKGPNGEANPTLANAANVTNTGVEVDFEAHPTNELTLRGGLEAMHSRFSKFPDATITVPLPGGGINDLVGDASGLATPHSPDFSANFGAEYRISRSWGDIIPAVNYAYTGAFAWDVDNRLKQNAYSLVNGSVLFTSNQSDWSLMLWAKNIGNVPYSIYSTANAVAGDIASPAPPRTFGFTLSKHFR